MKRTFVKMISGSHEIGKNNVLDVEGVDFTPEAEGAGDFGTVLCSKSDSAGHAPDACCTLATSPSAMVPTNLQTVRISTSEQNPQFARYTLMECF